MKKLIGAIDRITYFNEANNFAIVNVKIDINKSIDIITEIKKEYITVTSTFISKPKKGDVFEFIGDIINSKYGLQFKATTQSENKNNESGLISYLSSDEFKGVGVKLARKIYDKLGDDLIDKIANDKEVLSSIDGLKDNLKDVIYEVIKKNKETSKTVSDLMNLGLTFQFSMKIFKEYGTNSYYLIKENPYRLISDVDNVGFLKCDDIAINKLKMSKNNPVRLNALTNYVITNLTYQSNNTYNPYDLVFEKVNQLYNMTKEEFDKSLDYLVKEEKIYIDKENNIFDYFINNCEKIIARKIKAHLDIKSSDEINDDLINKAQKEIGIVLNKMQLKAVKKAFESNMLIITGGPGTGKTTIINAIISIYEYLKGNDFVNEDIKLVAPTGKASKKMSEVTHLKAETIHRFLGYKGKNIYEYGFNEKRKCKVIIIDEFSMVDTVLCARLLSGLYDDTKIIIVGDSDQLPSVSPGNCLYDLIKSGLIETVRLTKIHRQDDKSSITNLAYSINEGIIPTDILDKKADKSFIQVSDDKICEAICKTYKRALEVNGDSFNDIGVLIPMYKGIVGIDEVNKKIQDMINPFKDYELKHYNNTYRVGDKVINLVNNPQKQVTNGDTGYILDINHDANTFVDMTVRFDNVDCKYTFEELNELQLAYAISIHKAQGQEYKTVIMPISFKYYIMLNKKLVYTAITRAKKFLILIGDVKALDYASKHSDALRLSMLSKRIENEVVNKNYIDDKTSAFDEVYDLDKTPYDFMN